MMSLGFTPRAALGWRVGVLALAAMTLPASHATTLWTGPNTNFTQSTGAPADTVLAGKVVLKRGNRDGLFNTAAGESSPGGSSPVDTEWAFGTLANYSALSYQSLESLRNGNLAGVILNQPMVVHLINENIYLSLTFTKWGQHGSGGFAYTRSTPTVVVTPTVTITKPAPGATVAAPASIGLTATATGGTVTNVEFFAGTTSLGHATTAPFSITGSLPSPATYAIKAVATAAGVSGTSAVVNLTVVAPLAVTLTAPTNTGNLLAFSYSANPGLSYVVQRSSNLVNWVSIVTNLATASPVPFSEGLTPNSSRFYRVGRLPNP